MQRKVYKLTDETWIAWIKSICNSGTDTAKCINTAYIDDTLLNYFQGREEYQCTTHAYTEHANNGIQISHVCVSIRAQSHIFIYMYLSNKIHLSLLHKLLGFSLENNTLATTLNKVLNVS